MTTETTALTTLPTIFGQATASQVLALAKERAVILADVIKQRHLYVTIRSRDHVLVEGWTFLGSMVGLFPTVVWSRPVLGADGAIIGAEARVEVISASGDVRGSAEASCLYDEDTWAERPFYALRSMAQTRATSKALRLPLGFIMVLAGYEATPAEEVSEDGDRVVRRPAQKQAPRQVDRRYPAAQAVAREKAPAQRVESATAPPADETPTEREARLLAMPIHNIGDLFTAAMSEFALNRSGVLTIIGKPQPDIADAQEEWATVVASQLGGEA